MSHDPERERILRAKLSRADKCYEEARKNFDNVFCEYAANNHAENGEYLHPVASIRVRAAQQYVEALHALETEVCRAGGMRD